MSIGEIAGILALGIIVLAAILWLTLIFCEQQGYR